MSLRPLRIVSALHKALRQMTVHLSEQVAHLGVSGADGHLLSYVAVYGPAKLAELRRVFGHKPSTLTSLLDRLERQGWIVRTVDPDDRRSFLVQTTDAGAAIGDAARREVEAFEDALLDQLADRDLAGFDRVVGIIDRSTQVTLREK